jgi:hypothetical protein
MKVYGISYASERPRARVVEAAKQAALSVLPQPAAGGGRFGVGHEARTCNVVFVNWWADGNELHHRLFFTPFRSDADAAGRPTDLRPSTPNEFIGCTWDLAVIAFESQAWVEGVMKSPSAADLDRYLQKQLNADL